MSEFTWSDGSGESSNDDDKEKPKSKTKSAKTLGALTSFSAEKESKSDEKEKKSLLESLLEDEKKPEREESEKDDISDEAEPDKSFERTEPTPEEVEAAKREVLKEQLEEKIPQLEHEVANTLPDSPEHAAAQAALEVEQKLRVKVETPDVEVDSSIEEEFAKRMAEIGEDELMKSEPEEEREHDTFPEDFEIHEPTEKTIEPDAIADTEDDLTTSTTATPLPVTPKAAPTIPLPPLPTRARQQAPSPPPFTGTSAGTTSPGGNNLGSNTPPPPPDNANIYRQTQEDENTNERSRRKSRAAGAFLTGYMIGRRGGRKRAEARLKPEIDKLEKEKDATKKKLEAHENELSKHIKKQHHTEAEKTALKHELADHKEATVSEPEKPAVIEGTKAESKPAKEVLKHVVAPPLETISETPPETTLKPTEAETREPAPEHAAPITETTVVNIFNKAVEADERKPERVQTTNQDIRRIEQLSTPEILQRAEMLFISGVSVKELYNSNRIDRRGLIKIVQESMRGHDIKSVFEKVELGQERQRERAREFRHDDTGKPSSAIKTAAPVDHAKPIGSTLLHDVRSVEDHETHYAPLNVPATPNPDELEPLERMQAQEALEATSTPAQKQRSVAAPILAILVIIVALVIVYLLVQANL